MRNRPLLDCLSHSIAALQEARQRIVVIDDVNFLAHYVLATALFAATRAIAVLCGGNGPARFAAIGICADDYLRQAIVTSRLPQSAEEAALQAGVSVHLATDAAFHKTEAFARAQAIVSRFLSETDFVGIRVRRFFVAHILAELALDAVLVRTDPSIADSFYSAFNEANYAVVTRWTEDVVGKHLPHLPSVLARFAESHYLLHYQEPEGVATGLSRLCGRARQDTFKGENYGRLVEVVEKSTAALESQAEALLEETAEVMRALSEP